MKVRCGCDFATTLRKGGLTFSLTPTRSTSIITINTSFAPPDDLHPLHTAPAHPFFGEMERVGCRGWRMGFVGIRGDK